MSCKGEKFADAALNALGAPFRLNGGSPHHGLDCVGLIAYSLDAIGINVQRPIGYQLRHTSAEKYFGYAEASGFSTRTGSEERGDLILVRPGPAQHHLVIANGRNRYIHAHAGLRKVVLSELPSDWPVLKQWRLA